MKRTKSESKSEKKKNENYPSHEKGEGILYSHGGLLDTPDDPVPPLLAAPSCRDIKSINGEKSKNYK